MRVLKFIYGTAGWSYNDWLGLFYPQGTAPADYLTRYARTFPGVEVDSTYYVIPSVRSVAGWATATPETFQFFPKMVDQVTHKRFLVDCGDLVRQFLEAMQPLGPRLGAIVLQFPFYVSAFANSHYAGYAPATAQRLAELVLGTAPVLPQPSAARTPAAPTLFDEPAT